MSWPRSFARRLPSDRESVPVVLFEHSLQIDTFSVRIELVIQKAGVHCTARDPGFQVSHKTSENCSFFELAFAFFVAIF